MNQKKILVLIDDVWDIADVQYFLQPGNDAFHIVSTRITKIVADLVQWKPIQLKSLEQNESIELFKSLLALDADSEKIL